MSASHYVSKRTECEERASLIVLSYISLCLNSCLIEPLTVHLIYVLAFEIVRFYTLRKKLYLSIMMYPVPRSKHNSSRL